MPEGLDDPESSRIWTPTPEQERWLIQTMGEYSSHVQAERLGVTTKQVKGFYKRRGISKPRATPVMPTRANPGDPWSEEEATALEAGDALLITQRSRAARKSKAYRMGVRPILDDGRLSAMEVAKLYGVHVETIRRLVLAQVLPATKVGRLWRIEPEDAEKVPALLRERKSR